MTRRDLAAIRGLLHGLPISAALWAAILLTLWSLR
ncbi:hypothetical protein GA0074694_3084 [Micromonospora inyonensis]|uniref:Uncharacterized protein n=1 Tax=Micromonospora inyonensis TaxID=47866 RepID=A0A1C6R733_9ACTN|nr:hypothetical protein GA0074694_0015 [Micromonospora inyonensis]SCL21603.1 hypothetical protein GA0074694_3084 [Micromonospora inyonensis]